MPDDRCPVTGERNCQMCSGEYCAQCITAPCEHDVVERHEGVRPGGGEEHEVTNNEAREKAWEVFKDSQLSLNTHYMNPGTFELCRRTFFAARTFTNEDVERVARAIAFAQHKAEWDEFETADMVWARTLERNELSSYLCTFSGS